MDVCDGKYVGPMTVGEIIEQFEYRISIHESYAGLVLEDSSYEAYGTYEYHMWAIGGYREAIEKLLEPEPIEVTKCTITEAFATIGRLLLKIFGGKK